MKNLFFIFAICACIAACSGSKKNSEASNSNPKDTIRIANDSLNYELIIFEPGFDKWLVKQQPRGYYEQSYLEIKNRDFVTTYNNRVTDSPYNTAGLYPQQINYDYGINYGYEVNYLLYNYFLFFQEKNRQKL